MTGPLVTRRGPGIARNRALGEIDMRDIAPTLAQLLGAALPHATGRVVPVTSDR